MSSQNDNISQNLKDSLIGKYKKIYGVNYEEALFFVDLESTQINGKKDLDFIAGYFKKFNTSKINLLGEGSQFNCVIINKHTLALDLSRWEFEKIPKSINLLSKLQYLDLSTLKSK